MTLPRARWRLLLTILLATGMWLYFQCVLIPYQKNQSTMRQNPRGNLSDLYPRWLGARELLVHHRDPYGQDITREIQVGYYGRELDPTRPGEPKDQQGFAYPVYVVVILAPSVGLPFAVVREGFFWFLAVLTAASALLWLATLEWRLARSDAFLWVVLSSSCLPAVQALKLQQLTVLVVALVAASMWALAKRRFVLAGILLALATIKPQLVFLLVLWLCFWVLGNWSARQRALWSFAVTTGMLVAAGEVLLPGWITEFRGAMKDYYRYTGGGISLLDFMISPLWGRITAAILVLMLAIFVWWYRRAEETSTAFQWSICFTLATTLLVIPTIAPYNQLLLVPGVMMAVRARHELWAKSQFSRFLCTLSLLAVSWPFLSAAGLVISLAFLPSRTVQKTWGLPFFPSFAIPITIFAVLLVARSVLAAEGEPKSTTSAEPARLAT